jgi:hypothetical protein
MDYSEGAVKQHPQSLSVAVRSIWPADAWNAWGVMDPSNGGHWASADEVADWVDLPSTPVSQTDPEPTP